MRTLLVVVLLAAGCSVPGSVRSTSFAFEPSTVVPSCPAAALPASPPAPVVPRVASEPVAEPALWLGAEVRAYPAGVIPGLYAEKPLSAHGVLTFGLGANLTERDDFGEHDDEEGDGFGLGAGYRHYFGERLDRWFLGGRVDLWSLSIDWTDPGASGTSDVLVLQPTVEGGYGFRIGERSRLNLFAAGGAEINVDTDGEDVGEGAIGIVGMSFVLGF